MSERTSVLIVGGRLAARRTLLAMGGLAEERPDEGVRRRMFLGPRGDTGAISAIPVDDKDAG
jgi:hypothetical protein